MFLKYRKVDGREENEEFRAYNFYVYVVAHASMLVTKVILSLFFQTQFSRDWH